MTVCGEDSKTVRVAENEGDVNYSFLGNSPASEF